MLKSRSHKICLKKVGVKLFFFPESKLETACRTVCNLIKNCRSFHLIVMAVFALWSVIQTQTGKLFVFKCKISSYHSFMVLYENR